MRNGPYELVKAPDNYPGKKYRGKYCYEHILVWYQAHNSIPENGYEIHHVNKIEMKENYLPSKIFSNKKQTIYSLAIILTFAIMYFPLRLFAELVVWLWYNR